MALELKVIENVQTLTWTFETVKKELENHVAKYSNLVVSETNLKEMEKTQKEIAGLRIRLGKFKLATKADYLKPYELFELQVGQLATLIENAEKPIRDQLLKYEIKRKDEKREEIKNLFVEVSDELGLDEKYRSQMVVADGWLNRGTAIKAIKSEIQVNVCRLLDVQRTDLAEVAVKVEKVNMANMMLELLSIGLVNPLTFQDIENKIDEMNITELRAYIENQVTFRKDREERVAQLALEQAETARLKEVVRVAKEEQDVITKAERETARLAELENAKARQTEHVANRVDMSRESLVDYSPVVKLHNSQFVLYNVTSEQIKNVEFAITNLNIKFALSVKPVVIEEKQEVDY